MAREMRRAGTGRLAAWLALLAAAAVVAALVALVLTNFTTLLLVVAALAVAAIAGWAALARRGAVRVLSATVAAAALAGGAIALVARDAIDELVVFAVALFVFATTSGSAFRAARSQKTIQSRRSAPEARSTRAGRAVVILNPKSGGGKVARFDLIAEAKRRGIEPVLLGPNDDLRKLARDAADSADVIGVAGGDGSQALVAQVAMEHDVAFACVPAGTRNHLALDLGLDRDDVVGALDAFTSPEERRIDLAFVNDRIFVNNVSLGVYAQIVKSESYRDAKLRTVLEMAPALVGPDTEPFDLRFLGPDGTPHPSAQLLLVSNNPYGLDRLGGVTSRPRLDTGQLGIVTLEMGGTRPFGGWSEWTADRFEVDSGSRVAAGIDGEAVFLDPPLRFTISPTALRVRLPPSAAGLSPAAMRPGLKGSPLRELWEIATARRDPGPATRRDADRMDPDQPKGG
jgi:diacylglycerol kinase family enzyme